MAIEFQRRDFADGEDLALELAEWTAERLRAAIADQRRGAARRVRRHDAGAILRRALDACRSTGRGSRSRSPTSGASPTTARASNARLVRDALLRNHAAVASFTPLADARLTKARSSSRRARASPACRCPPTSSCSAWARTAIRRRGFPARRGSPRRWIRARQLVAPIEAVGADEPRLTLTGRVILRARAIALQHRRRSQAADVRRRARGWTEEEMPIRAVLRRAGDRLTVFSAARS